MKNDCTIWEISIRRARWRRNHIQLLHNPLNKFTYNCPILISNLEIISLILASFQITYLKK